MKNQCAFESGSLVSIQENTPGWTTMMNTNMYKASSERVLLKKCTCCIFIFQGSYNLYEKCFNENSDDADDYNANWVTVFVPNIGFVEISLHLISQI